MNRSIETVLRRLAPIVAAFAIFVIALQLTGFAGTDVIGAIIRGSVGTPNALLQSVRWSFPLMLVGLAALVSFRAGYFNVGGLGQFYLGAIAATAVSTSLPDAPPFVTIPLSLLAGIAAGALWSGFPGFLRVRYGADEVVTTIMANFIAQLLLAYLVSGPMMDRSSATAQGAASPPVPEQFRISSSTGISPITIGLVVVAVVIIAFVINRTSFGILSGIAGRNGLMLAWQGIRVNRIGIQSFLISGGLAGLAGSMEILGPTGKLVTGISPQIGNNAILVALVAGLAVSGAIVSAFFFGALTAASLFLPVAVQLPASAIVVLNGIIAILVTAHVKLPALRRAVPSPKLDRPSPGSDDHAKPKDL
ncbi:ABC transporter permease [Microbacterium sp. 18062]|uniref:ABC transporter permease n=1 Tax=Microbacterium sp. 18062 TaxID=2681410 RepID=UPI001358EEAC|nr:ABC transporter permease [Microbacterium sp. 18062]